MSARRCSTSTNDRDLDLVLAADGAPPVAVLNDRLGRFHEAPIKGSDATAPVVRPARRPTSTRTAAPTSWPRPRRAGRRLAERDRADHRRGDQARLRVMADQRGRLASGAGRSTSTSTAWPDLLGLPAASGKPGGLSAGLGAQRGQAVRDGDAAARPGGPRPRRPAGRRPGRRRLARHPGDPPR